MIVLEPIGVVRSARGDVTDDNWGGVEAEIVLDDRLPAEALDGLEDFSHVEVIYHFHRVAEDAVVVGARRPRDNPAWPRVGILAQRGKNRPNRLGATVARMVRRDGRALFVRGLDAVDGTPVLDVKPVLRETVVQPAWATELMRDYWE